MPQSVKKKGKARKVPFFNKLEQLFIDYPAVLIVNCDNIGSSHMQRIKKALIDTCVFVKGKNTLIRKMLKLNEKDHPEWLAILPYIRWNIGLVFCKGDLSETKSKLLELRISAPAKVGTVAPDDVVIKKGGTGLEPTKTAFLQALNIASKINRGQIDILQDVLLIKKGTKIGNSESALLTMLSKKPFSYGLSCDYVFEDGKIYSSKFLDMSTQTLMQKFSNTVSIVASVSLALGIPTIASVPHAILNTYKNLLAVVMETGYLFEQAREIKEMVDNPDAFVQAPVEVVTEKEPEPDPEPEIEEVKEESGEDMGFSFFDAD